MQRKDSRPLDIWFKEIGGFENVYPHQIEVARALQSGKSVLFRAPTGSGKTEAVLIPFLKLRRKQLPNRLIYSLPMRVLVEDIGERAKNLSSKCKLNLSIHHGIRVEDPMFQGDIIVTTIDQTISSYSCVPLSFSVKHGSIPAGAVATSFLVFDEIQLLDPELGLQAILILAKRSIELHFPVVIMTATLPNIFIEKFVKELPKNVVEIIDNVNENDVPVRANRHVKLFWKENYLTSEEVQKIYKNTSDEKIIVVCNTVNKAQEIYKNLKIPQKYLLHSRFLNEDRKEKEKKVKQVFGKNGKGKGVLVTTQIIEAGIDISSSIILTELAPIDSIVQRAGRCARWGGDGKFFVYNIEYAHPYLRELVENTGKVIKKNSEAFLTWDLEKSLIDGVLGKFVEEMWLNIKKRSNVIALLAEVAFEGNKNKISQAVRDEFNCEVSICKNPLSLRDKIVKLERIRVPLWTLRKWVEEYKIETWEVVESNIIDEDVEVKWNVSQITDTTSILPFKHYILSPDKIGYTKKLGLIPGKTGKDFPFNEDISDKEIINFSYKTESWVEHIMKTEAEIKKILEFYSFELNKIAQYIRIEVNNFKRLIITIAKFHDLGKLSKEWQESAGWDGRTPLAHTDKKDCKLPPHAPISAWAISDWIRQEIDKEIAEAFLLAVAHHHSVRSSYYPRYKFIFNWQDILYEINIEKSIIDKIIQEAKKFHLPKRFPDFRNIKQYRIYIFISRILKFADWKATGGDKCNITF